MPNQVSISGHTDGGPYTRGGSYSNWELSSDRALSSRSELTRYGLPPARITKVVGRADTEHLVASDPKSPRNRRIAITLLRQNPPPPKVGNTPKADVSPTPRQLPDALKPPTVPKIAPPPPVATGVGGLRLPPAKP
jgi:chemotaxis protein MotB